MRPALQAAIAGVVVASAASVALSAAPSILGTSASLGAAIRVNVTHTWTIAPRDKGKTSFQVNSGLASFPDHEDFFCFASLQRTRPTFNPNNTSSCSFYMPFIRGTRTTFKAGVDTQKLAKTDSQLASQILAETQFSLRNIVSLQDLNATRTYHPILGNFTCTRVVGSANAVLIPGHGIEGQPTVTGTVIFNYYADMPASPSKAPVPNLKGKLKLKFLKAPIAN